MVLLKSRDSNIGGVFVAIEIDFVFGILILLVICIVLTNFFMKIANFIGDKLKIGVLFMKLLKKARKHK